MEFLRLHIKKINYTLLFLLFLYILDQIWTLIEVSIRDIAKWGEVYYSDTIMHVLFILFLLVLSIFIYRQKRVAYWGLVCVMVLSFVLTFWILSGSFKPFADLRFTAVFLIKVFLIFISLIMIRLRVKTTTIKSETANLTPRRKLSFYIKTTAIVTTFLIISVQLLNLFEGIAGLIERDLWTVERYLLPFLYTWIFGLLYVIIMVVLAYKVFYSKFSLLLVFLVPLFLYPAMLFLSYFILNPDFLSSESGLGLILLLLYGEPIVFILSSILSSILYIKKKKYIQSDLSKSSNSE